MAWTERYVTTTGAGAHDGTTEGNAWDLAEALTAAAAGQRVNIKTGAYSSGADAVTNPGTMLDWISFRGYNSTIGDLDGQGRNADGTLNTTNFPVITLTGRLSLNAFVAFQNIAFTASAVSSDIIGPATIDNVQLLFCSITNTTNNAAARCAQVDNYSSWIMCDFIGGGASRQALLETDTSPVIVGCRFDGRASTSTNAALLRTDNPTVIDSTFIGDGDSNQIAVELIGQSTVKTFVNNTFYKCAVGIQMGNHTNLIPVLINNHVTDCAKWLDNTFVATDSVFVNELFTRTRDNTTPRTGIEASWNIGEVITDTGGHATDYVAATGSPPNLRLISGAPGESAGMIAYEDIGAFQREASAGSGVSRRLAKTYGAG